MFFVCQIPTKQPRANHRKTTAHTSRISKEANENSNKVHKNWTQQQMAGALQAIKAGMSVLKAASTFNIPFATVHYTANRRGILLSRVKPADNIQLNTALEAVRSGMSWRKAAEKFNIPTQTLRRHGKSRGISGPNDHR